MSKNHSSDRRETYSYDTVLGRQYPGLHHPKAPKVVVPVADGTYMNDIPRIKGDEKVVRMLQYIRIWSFWEVKR